MKKRIISFLIIFCLVAYIPVVNVNASSTIVGNQSEISTDDDISIRGTNSFGDLLTASLEEKMNQQEENNGYNIFSVEMIDNGIAAVSFETLQDCMLVVGIYDETGKTMLTSGSLEVYAGETDTYVDIETDSIPEYFYLRAFLIDADSFRPLCTSYESPNYTQEMQDFLDKTIDDFEQEKVLNLDGDNTKNFAVYSEKTIVIPQTENTNRVVSADDENNIYVIENVDSSITSLNEGDTFAYEYGDNDIIIVKIASIKFNGTTATITGENTSLEEAFDYIKIDTESNSTDATVDASGLEDGITYEGMIKSEDASEIQTYGADLGGSATASLAFKMKDKQIGSAKVSGSVDLKVSASAKVYISSSYQYIELKMDYSAKTVLSLSAKGYGKLSLAYMCFVPIPGLIVEVTPAIVVDASVKAEVSGTLKGCVGFKVSNTEGMVNLTKSPTFNPEFKIEGTIFVGISLEPKVKVISDKIASVSMTAKVGAEVKGVLSKKPENNINSIHECKNCIDGDVNAKVTLSFEAKLVNWDRLKFTLNLVNWSVKICDFYFSYDFAEFAFTPCPHYKHKVTIYVTDSNSKKEQGAIVKIDGKEYQTDENGCVTIYLNNGNYKLTAQKTEVGKAQTTFTVDDNAVKISMCLYKNSSNCDENNNDGKLSLGGNHHSAAIAEDGSLYTWGRNYQGQLGNGTKTDSLTPIKIMDNVKSVSLGYSHSAAITEDGSLYTWGYNSSSGELGNGTTTDSLIPIKIMDNVKSVSLGGYHSAAITEDGSLYTWGWNMDGQLGNGTKTNSLTPIKIMDNVKSVSLGDYHSAAITEDGNLYTWGWNDWGQLGNGTTTDSQTPIKITIPVETATASVTNLLVTTCTLSTLSVADTSIKSFSDMRANEIYNVYAIKSADAENILEADNLLYITQVLSDENGTLSVPYGFDEEYDDPVWLVVPMTQTDISSAEITVDDLQYTGEDQFVNPVVKLNGEILVEGESYYLEKDYSAVEPGEYRVSIIGSGLYKGSVDVLYKVIETEHIFGEWTTTKASTCTDDGMEERVCSVCGEKETRTVHSMGHTVVTDRAVAATCTKDGKTEGSHCSVCGKVLETQKIVKATGHKFGSWITTKTATYTAAGIQTRKCTICGKNETKIIAKKSHDLNVTLSNTKYNYDGKAKKPSVTVKNGTKTLVSGTDYTVTYSNNVNIGTATVTVTGIGDYKGTISKNFTIVFGIPQLTSAVNNTAGITVKWSRITGAAGYIVYRKTGSGAWGRIADIKSGSTTSYVDKSAKSNTTYTYTVRAYNSKYMSEWNSTKTIKRIIDPTLTSAANTTSGIQIKWNKVTGATGYIVYRKTGSAAWGRIADIKSGSTVSYTDTTAKTGTVYTYTVRAYSGDTMSYWHSTKQLRRLADPVLSSAVNVTSGVDVKWAFVKGATGYIIYRKSGKSDWSRIAYIRNGSITSYTDKTAKSGTTYSYTIRAYNGSVMSCWHGAKSIKRLSDPGVTAAQVTSKGVNVKWTKVTGASGYIVYRCTKYGSWSRIADIKSGSTINYLDKNIKKGIKYIYTVRAYSGSTMSSWSSIKDAVR